jgi:GTP cyclohydrolase II
MPLTFADGSTALTEFISFNGLLDGKEHFAIKLGTPDKASPLVRLHSECVTGDIFGSVCCDCHSQLAEALEYLHEHGGYLLYLRQEGCGIGLSNQLNAYRLQDKGDDTYAANREPEYSNDERECQVAASMLKALNIKRIVLLSNNPDKKNQLIARGIQVDLQAPNGAFLSECNHRHLESKVAYPNHAMDIPTPDIDKHPLFIVEEEDLPFPFARPSEESPT